MEVYNRIREEVGLEGLEESDIDRQALNCLHTVPLTDEIVKEEDSDEECIEVVKRLMLQVWVPNLPLETGNTS